MIRAARLRTALQRLNLIDFDDPRANDWLVVNQLAVQGSKFNRRPDVVVYLNCLLLAVLEVKNPAEDKVAIWAAYNQRQTSSRYRSGPPAAPPHQSLVSNTVTSREWLGSEDRRDYARGAMWGDQGAFCTNHSLYVFLRALTQLRDSEPELRYGCKHFRPVGDGVTDQFGYSHYQQALLAFSRILNDRELVVVVEVANLNPLSSKWKLLFSTADPGAGDPLPISPSATCTFASSHTCIVTLQPMQGQVLQRS